jgi:hypothetical protein
MFPGLVFFAGDVFDLSSERVPATIVGGVFDLSF